MVNNNKNIISFFHELISNEKLNPSHVSMYVSLLQGWSFNHFKSPFRISREDVMKSSKIKSIATYHKCINELCLAGFIDYIPSYNPYVGSLIKINERKERKDLPKRFAKKRGVKFSIPKVSEVNLYFEERSLDRTEAESFYSFYKAIDWRLVNDKPMKSWQAAARNWIIKRKKAKFNEKY